MLVSQRRLKQNTLMFYSCLNTILEDVDFWTQNGNMEILFKINV